MKAVALIEVHRPGDFWNIVAWAGHARGFQLYVNGIAAGDGREDGYPSSDDELFEKNTVFVGVGTLGGKNDDYLFSFQNRSFRYGNGESGDEKLLAGIYPIDVGEVVRPCQAVEINIEFFGDLWKCFFGLDGVEDGLL